MRRRRLLFATLTVMLAAGAAFSQTPAPSRTLILSTTTSTQDSGLLDVLVPMFEQATGYSVKTVSVGTGQALALAARGEADVTLAHAPALEKKYVDEGKMLNRRLVMYNDFVLIGPAEDPAKIKGLPAVEALQRIAAAEARFVSRGTSPGPISSSKPCGSRPRSSQKGPGTSSLVKGWGRRCSSPLSERPTR